MKRCLRKVCLFCLHIVAGEDITAFVHVVNRVSQSESRAVFSLTRAKNGAKALRKALLIFVLY